MIQLNLAEDEVRMLSDLVDTCINDLRDEIHATDNPEYKAMLRQRREILTKLLSALTASQNQ